ncbi:MAG: hypothetical protein ACRDG3_08830 [Tepidiformaceae bacterium]
MGSAPDRLDEFNDALTRPITELIAEYAAALTSANTIASKLDALAASLSPPNGATAPEPAGRDLLAGRVKPQARPLGRPRHRDDLREAVGAAPSVSHGKARTVEVTIAMDSLADIETFEAALQAVPAVQRITVERIEAGAAVLKLECGKGSPPPTVVCTRCGIILEKGGRAISHGLCADCATAATTALR